MEVADETLMAWIAEGRTDAFTMLVRRYEAKARRFCYRILRDVQIAEDAAQDVFLKLYRNAHQYRPMGKFSTYFYRVLGNLCFDRLRFEKRRAHVRSNPMDGAKLDAHPDGAATGGNGRFRSPETALLKKEEAEIVRRTVAGLPENLRRAIELREFEGLKYREIAEVLGVTLNDVKVLIHRGRKQVARRLKRVLQLENRP